MKVLDKSLVCVRQLKDGQNSLPSIAAVCEQDQSLARIEFDVGEGDPVSGRQAGPSRL